MAQARTRSDDESRRYVDIKDLMVYTSLGRNKAMKLGVDANAKIKLGKRAIYDLQRVDEHLQKLMSQEDGE